MNVFMTSISRAGEYACQLAHGLGKKDKVTIALNMQNAVMMQNDFPGFFADNRFKIVPVSRARVWNPKKYITALTLLREIIKAKSDVIHDQNCHWLENIIVLSLSSLMGIPIVITIHDALPHPGDEYPAHLIGIISQNLCLADQVIVHGEHIKETLLEHFNLDPRLINVIPHGNYDIYLHSKKEHHVIKTDNEVRVLLIGRMVKYKGLEILEKASPEIIRAFPNAKIVFAGAGPELNRLKETLEKNSCFEIINKRLSSSEFANETERASLLVLPYLEASQSGPLNLAFSFKKPVVATKVGAIPEVLEHGREGLLIPPNDPGALAEAVIQILKSPELAKRMGENGLKKAGGLLSWEENIADKTREVYDKALYLKKNRIRYHKKNHCDYCVLFRDKYKS